MPTPVEVVEVDGHAVRVTNPAKVFFPELGITKLDLVRYYLDVMPGVLRGARGRPTTMYRWPNGVDRPEDAFYQKRVSDKGRPEWLQTTVIRFPSGRTAEMAVVADAAHVVWLINMGCVDLNPWPVRAPHFGDGDLDHPDELRVDLDPTPGVDYADVCRVAPTVRAVLEEHGLVGAAKTSGKRGMHIYVAIEPRWPFTEVRRAALALAREVERRMPDVATTAWWKEERRGVFVDYNQNARDRTIASAYSVRPVPNAGVSCPLAWDEIDPGLDPAAFRIDTVPERFATRPDPWGALEGRAASLESLLELADRDEREGLGDAPWPPNFPKAENEPPRVQPSRRRRPEGAGVVPPPAPGKKTGPTGRRRTTAPLIEVARAQTRVEAMDGLERWKQRHPDVWPHLEPRDVLVDSMRGRSSTWTRVRLNLANVPEEQRPSQEALEVDYDPWEGVAPDGSREEAPEAGEGA